MLSSRLRCNKLKYRALPRAARGLYTLRCWSSSVTSCLPSSRAAATVKALALVSLRDDSSALSLSRLPLYKQGSKQHHHHQRTSVQICQLACMGKGPWVACRDAAANPPLLDRQAAV